MHTATTTRGVLFLWNCKARKQQQQLLKEERMNREGSRMSKRIISCVLRPRTCLRVEMIFKLAVIKYYLPSFSVEFFPFAIKLAHFFIASILEGFFSGTFSLFLDMQRKIRKSLSNFL